MLTLLSFLCFIFGFGVSEKVYTILRDTISCTHLAFIERMGRKMNRKPVLNIVMALFIVMVSCSIFPTVIIANDAPKGSLTIKEIIANTPKIKREGDKLSLTVKCDYYSLAGFYNETTGFRKCWYICIDNITVYDQKGEEIYSTIPGEACSERYTHEARSGIFTENLSIYTGYPGPGFPRFDPGEPGVHTFDVEVYGRQWDHVSGWPKDWWWYEFTDRKSFTIEVVPPGNDEVLITSLDPPVGSKLTPSEHVAFAATVSYTLRSEDAGVLELQILDQSENWIGSDTTSVGQGSGSVQLTVSCTIPEDATVIKVYAKLFPGDATTTNVYDVKTFNVARADLTVSKILVVQVVEGGKLVADKGTAVRVWVDTAGECVEDVKVKLLVDGVPYESDFAPKVVLAKISDYNEIQRYRCEDSFNFYVGGFTPGKHKLKAIVNCHYDINDLNNEKEIEIEVKETRGIRIGFSRLTVPPTYYKGSNTRCKTTQYFAEEASRYFKHVYPISPRSYGLKLIPDYDLMDCTLMYSFIPIPVMHVVAFEFENRREWYNLWNDPNLDFLVAVLPTNLLDWPFGIDGVSVPGLRRAPLVDEDDPMSMCHEIGHYYGLGFPEEYEANPNKIGNRIRDLTIYDGHSEHFLSAEVGLGLQFVITPLALPTYCFMASSTVERWVEVKCYNKLYSKLVKSNPNSHNSEILFVSGVIHRNDTVTLFPWYLVNGTNAETEDVPPGDYSVDCLSDTGEVLNSVKFDVQFQDANCTPFVLTVLYPTGTSKVVIKHNATVIKEVVPSSSVPTVTMLTPNGGENINATCQITWSAADPDGDDLSYSLLHSHNGGASWIPIVHNLKDTSYLWNASQFPGGTDCLIKVVATDGFNTVEDESDDPFSITTKAPEVYVDSPSDGSKFAFGTYIVLSGYGYDLEDGRLNGSSLSWNSNNDGYLGEGNLLITSNLSLGVHEITFTASDSDGLKSSDAVSISVRARALTMVDHLLCKDVSDDGTPSDVATTFKAGETIISWLEVANGTQGDEISWVFQGPNAINEEFAYTLEWDGEGYCWAPLDLNDYNLEDAVGDWSVTVYINGLNVFTDNFTVEPLGGLIWWSPLIGLLIIAIPISFAVVILVILINRRKT